MKNSILHILANLDKEYRHISRIMQLPNVPNKQKRTSNKSKLKQTKSSPNNKYKTSSPMKSKSITQFRNKSNI